LGSLSDRDGTLLVRNAPSPAATSSLAIAEYVVEQMSPRAEAPGR